MACRACGKKGKAKLCKQCSSLVKDAHEGKREVKSRRPRFFKSAERLAKIEALAARAAKGLPLFD